jgi:hypothetical protein
VDGRATPAGAKRPPLPDVGIQGGGGDSGLLAAPYSSMLHASLPGPLDALAPVPGMQPLLPLAPLTPLTPLAVPQPAAGLMGGMAAPMEFPAAGYGAGFGDSALYGGLGGAALGSYAPGPAPGRDSLALLLESLQLPGWEGATVVKVDDPQRRRSAGLQLWDQGQQPEQGQQQAGRISVPGQLPKGFRPISASSRLQNMEVPGFGAIGTGSPSGALLSSRPGSGRQQAGGGGSRPGSGRLGGEGYGPVAGRRAGSAAGSRANVGSSSILEGTGAGAGLGAGRGSSTLGGLQPGAAAEDASLMALGSRRASMGEAGAAPAGGPSRAPEPKPWIILQAIEGMRENLGKKPPAGVAPSATAEPERTQQHTAEGGRRSQQQVAGSSGGSQRQIAGPRGGSQQQEQLDSQGEDEDEYNEWDGDGEEQEEEEEEEEGEEDGGGSARASRRRQSTAAAAG